ncbi:hypothetical protein EON65_44620 [archaeon]|nr:MAG: hypothetical protein EON65_44620 [archaeon]
MDEEKQNEHLLQASLQWRLEDELVAQFHAMLEQKADEGDGIDGQFSIGELYLWHSWLFLFLSLFPWFSLKADLQDNLYLPPVLQDDLRGIFDNEKNLLLQRIEALEQEIKQSQTAFDKYRDRARESLKKSASELHGTEQTLKSLKDQLKSEIQSHELTRHELHQSKQQHMISSQEVRRELAAERMRIDGFFSRLREVREEIVKAQQLEQERVRLAQEQLETQKKLEEDEKRGHNQVNNDADYVAELFGHCHYILPL